EVHGGAAQAPAATGQLCELAEGGDHERELVALAVRKAGADEGIQELGGRGDAQGSRTARGPELRALPSRGEEGVSAHRIDGAPRYCLALLFRADRAGEYREAVCVVGGAVERVDDEADVAAPLRSALLRQDARSGRALLEHAQDGFFGGLVRVGDEIDAALEL